MTHKILLLWHFLRGVLLGRVSLKVYNQNEIMRHSDWEPQGHPKMENILYEMKQSF
jgi:hypothetical protein